MKILTIVVPTYNMEKYINKNLDSFIDSRILDDIEVLIVNDGSTDGTESIARSYVEKFPKTFFLINKKNGGHGSAVNCGIKNASGKYFKIVDADDWVDTESLVNFVERLKSVDVDLFLTNYQTVDINNNKIIVYKFKDNTYNKTYNVFEATKNGNLFPMHSLCYRASILKENNISLQEGIYYVDEEFNVLPFVYVRNIYFYDVVLYNYLIGNCNQSTSVENQVRRIDHKIKIIKRLIDYIDKGNFDAVNKEYCYRKIAGMITSVYLIMLIYNKNKSYGRKFTKQFHDFIKNKSTKLEQMSNFKYNVFIFMSFFGISQKSYDMIIGTFKKLIGR